MCCLILKALKKTFKGDSVRVNSPKFKAQSYELTTNNFELKTRGYSSAGRAPALQAGGQRFDPVYLHHGRKSSENIGLRSRNTDMGL